MFNFVARSIAVGGFNDTQCGFKLFRADAARDIFTRVRLYGDDAAKVTGAAVTAYDVEVIFLAVKRGYKVKEVPTEWLLFWPTLRAAVCPSSDMLQSRYF
ncbi:MAG: hypothetical protein E6J26_07790 [Chloroflexi bacterium]|nr:MAG: hypothetical protein E6J26_07790 [Chloroflexota bacterium]